MLKVRLRRVGKRNQPSYRVVITEHTRKPQGAYIEAVGAYNPRAREFSVKEDRVIHWLDQGAQPSERVAKLLISAGVAHRLLALPDYDRKPKRAVKNPEKFGATETPAPEAAPAEQAETQEPTSETEPSDTADGGSAEQSTEEQSEESKNE